MGFPPGYNKKLVLFILNEAFRNILTISIRTLQKIS
jgi:hypothetical protein